MSNLKHIDEREVYELLPILDAFTEPQDLANCEADFMAMAAGLTKLAQYAATKKRAMKLRLAGKIAGAQALEKVCEERYAKLPQWARW